MKRTILKTDILIIGAGIYGISAANSLSYSGKNFIICGDYMDLWFRHTFDSMTLRSDFMLSEVYHPEKLYSSENFLKEYPEFSAYSKVHLPVFVFRKYLKWVQKKLPYKIFPDLVKTLEYNEATGTFRALFSSDREIVSRKVIAAPGLSYFIHVPPMNSGSARIIHSYYTEKIEKIKDQGVKVIGAGQSAAETIAALMKNNNDINHVFQHKPVYLKQPVNVPLWLFKFVEKSPALFFKLPAFLKKILNRLLSRPTVMPSYSHLLKKVSGKNTGILSPDYIVSATGYRFEISKLSFLSDSIREVLEKYPNEKLLNKYFETPVKGLFLAGPLSGDSFGPSVRFIIGANYSSQIISKELNKDF